MLRRGSWLRRHGLVVLIAALGVEAAIAGSAGSDIGAAVGALGAILGAVAQIRVSERERFELAARQDAAAVELGIAARRFESHVGAVRGLAGTAVLDGAMRVEIARLGEEIRLGRFNFAPGSQSLGKQLGWAELGAALRAGAQTFLARSGAIADLPAAELAETRRLADVATRAAKRAYAVASAYATFDVDTAQVGLRAEDATLNLSSFTPYRDLGEDLAELGRGLARLAAAAPGVVAES